MANYNDLFIDEYRYALTNISFKKLPVVSVPGNETKSDLSLQDSLTVGQRTGTEVHVSFCRKVEFNPESNYSLSIEFDMIFEFQKTVDRNTIQDSEIVQVLEEEVFISEVIAKASLLISQITLIFNHNPMVLPPNFIPSVEDK